MKRLFAFLLVISLVASIAFAAAANEVKSSNSADDPFAEYVELTMYSSGSSGKDTEKVMAKFNELLKEKCNTTINVTCLGWDNYRNQYQLILTTGEDADLMYVNPNLYSLYAPSGAFTDVTELFPKYMPTISSYFSEGQLAQLKVDGKLYMIPSYETNYNQNGIFYRLDLAKKAESKQVVNSLDPDT